MYLGSDSCEVLYALSAPTDTRDTKNQASKVETLYHRISWNAIGVFMGGKIGKINISQSTPLKKRKKCKNR